jgi:aspartate/methionine/tyrosine aminotransferase
LFIARLYTLYFPLSSQVGEEEAVHILATEYGVLLMPGSAFGAPQHLRLSYGSIPPAQVLAAVDKIEKGLSHLQRLSAQRQVECPTASL